MIYRDYRTSKIMLLGPGEYLSYRRNVQNELFTIYRIDPANIIIMEDIVNAQYGTLHDKFVRIIEEYHPNLYVAFFHKDADMQSVVYEIALLYEKFGSELFRNNRLRFLGELKFDWNDVSVSAYIKSLYPNTPRADFDSCPSGKSYHKASKLIHTMAQSIVNG